MLIPIWAATWEIECCQPEAEVGKEWKVPVIFRPGADPWWVTDHGAGSTGEHGQLGVVRLEATSEEVDADLGQQLMTAGPISFRAATDVSAGVIEGRLHLDAHGDSPFRGRDEVRGVVGRIQLVPLRYVEQAERHFVPAEQLDAVEVDTTLAREQLRSREAEHVYVDLLVWLEIPDEQPHHG